MPSMQLHTQHGQVITLSTPLGKGGEAEVFNVAEQPDVVAKLYHYPTAEKETKLVAMLARPPQQPDGQPRVAWPTELLYRANHFVGFLMPKVSHSQPIFQHYNPALRHQSKLSSTWRTRHQIARQLMGAAQTIHDSGHVIGDVNESNILVNTQTHVTFVDADSCQIAGPQGELFRCRVGKPEYTPPELQGVSFAATTQTVSHDWFRLAVLVFQLLMEGYHPFTGVLRNGLSVGRVDVYCIKQGLFPYHGNSLIDPPPLAPPYGMLHPDIQAAFQRCFVEGHDQPARRPTTHEWQQLLQQAEQTLITCHQDSSHRYSHHLTACPWCELAIKRLQHQQSWAVAQPSVAQSMEPPETSPGVPLGPAYRARPKGHPARRQLAQAARPAFAVQHPPTPRRGLWQQVKNLLGIGG